MSIDLELMSSFLPVLLKAAWQTTLISASAFLVAFTLGLVIAIARMAPAPINWVGATYVEIVRNTPFLLQLLLLFYGLPSMGIHLSSVVVGIIALGLNCAAYLAEIFRSGIGAVPRGMHEAADALSMNWLQKIRFVTVPEAIRIMFPAIGNMLIYTILGSSVLSVIAVTELTGKTNEISASTFQTVPVYSVAVLIYIAMTAAAGVGLAQLGRTLFPAKKHWR